MLCSTEIIKDTLCITLKLIGHLILVSEKTNMKKYLRMIGCVHVLIYV